MSEKSQQFLEQLQEAVATDQLKFPSLPDVALHIRIALESEADSAQQIADSLSHDPSLATRLLQLANSPLYRARAEIEENKLMLEETQLLFK